LAIARQLKRRLLAVSSPKYYVRGPNPAAREHADAIAGTVLHGYHAALDDNGLESLDRELTSLAPDERGYAFEGAAMALTLLDLLSVRRRDRVAGLISGPGAPYVHMIYVGIGWGLARLPWSFQARFRRLDPLLRWLAIDGYGFHEGFFRAPAAIDRQEVPSRVRGYARHAFDQGLGRSLWFVETADPTGIGRTIAAFPAARRSDMWAGVGLACCYAGGVEKDALDQLVELADGYRPELAQGVAFAAAARVLGRTAPPHSRLACEVVTGRSLEDLADLAQGQQIDPAAETIEQPAYEVWRRRIQNSFQLSVETR
jgi:enediyne biosynthesis protein E3